MTARVFACGLHLSVAAIGAFGAANAQPTPGELRLEGGAAQIRQSDRDTRPAGLISALWRAGQQRFAVLASGAFTFVGDSATAVQGIGALAWRPSVENAWRTEGGITGAGFGVYQLGRGGNVSSFVRERVVLPDGSFWLGGAAGHTVRDDISSHSTTLDGGAAVRSGGFEVRASWARVRSSDRKLFEASGIFVPGEVSAHEIDDMAIALHYERARVTLDLSHTWREGRRATSASQTALYGSAEYGFTPRVSIAVTAGRLLADPVRGVPDVQIISAMLRLVVLRWRDEDDDERAPGAWASVAPTAEGAILTVTVKAAESQHVEVAGSFSGWEPVALRRTAGGWEARIALRSGLYRVGVRIDDGTWRAPANLGKVRDEFGGTSGIIVVP